MDAAQLTRFIVTEEQAGRLSVGEAIVVGLHEPPPIAGGLRVGRVEGGRTLVEEHEAGQWQVRRRYELASEAHAHAFDVLGEITAARYWGDEFWAQRHRRVTEGAVLRTAVLLLDPRWNMIADRWELVQRLTALGLTPQYRYWVDGVDGMAEPEEEILELHRTPEGWLIGVAERGSLSEWGRFSRESDACRAMFVHVVTSAAAGMGSADGGPYVTELFRSRVAAALEDALVLVRSRIGTPG
jgi:hypothetical protein